MAKFLIPSILVATILIAGAFALLPIEEAMTIHLTGGGAAAGANTVDSASIINGEIVSGDISATADIAGTQLAAAANIVGTQLSATAAIVSGQVDFFQSAEITGSGAVQNTAHGLGRTPSLVIVYVTEDTGLAGTIDLLEGAHDGTNVIVTAPTTVKYKIIAF